MDKRYEYIQVEDVSKTKLSPSQSCGSRIPKRVGSIHKFVNRIAFNSSFRLLFQLIYRQRDVETRQASRINR